MFNVTRSARGNKRLAAGSFAFAVMAVVFVGFTVATSSSTTYHLTLHPNSIYYFSISGNFLTIFIEVSSSEPVTVCITDATGLAKLKAGEKALCYMYVENVRDLKRVWRNPTGGQIYLVIISEKPAEAIVTIKRGIPLR